MPTLYFDDLVPGLRYRSGPLTVDLAAIQDFARQFDPQPFHLDPEAAKQSAFGELVASGWHTMGLTMRMLVDSPTAIAGGIVGLGVEGLQWPRPTRPGDTLRVESEVAETTPSRSRPDRGTVLMRNTTFNQADEPVMLFTARLIVPRRAA